MDKVINFNIARIESELDRYRQGLTSLDKISPHSVDDLKTDYYEKLTEEYKSIADAFIADYHKFQNVNREEVVQQLKKDYAILFRSFATSDADFVFPGVLKHYRYGINPVVAIYYEMQTLCVHPERDEGMHYWLEDMLTEPEFNKKIVTALERDIKSLKHIIVQYYRILKGNEENMPIELYHAKRKIDEFSRCCAYFKDMLRNGCPMPKR